MLWWIAIALEGLVLVRSCDAKLCRKYPAFYLYLTTVLFLNLLRFSVFSLHPSAYAPFYWYTELLEATVGYGVVIEIYKQALKRFPGVAHVARTVLFGLLVAVVLKVMVGSLTSPVWSPAATIGEFGRDLHAIQSLSLVVIIGLLAYYEVPISRNVKGIAFGYSFYVGASVMSLAFGSLPRYALQPGWQLLQQIAHLVALFVWCCTLWSYQPPRPGTEFEIERDYRSIADQTRKALFRAHSFLKQSGEV